MAKHGRKQIMLRYAIIILLMMLLAGAVAWHLFDNTVVTAEKWNSKAQEELGKVDTIPAERGDILAADGSILATNMTLYTVRVDFNVKKFRTDRFKLALDSLCDSMARYFPIRDKKGWKEYLGSQVKAPEGKRWSCMPLLNKASISDIELIKTFPFFKMRPKFTGLYTDELNIRTNPYGRMALRSIGRVGQEKKDPTRRGRSGLELALETFLRGKPGYTKKVAMTSGMEDWVDIPPTRGYDVLTTIDIKMQDIVEHELNKMLEFIQSDWGLCVLMDVATGDIKAISNLQRTSKGDYIEGMNRAVQQIEPGSVIKILSMMVALDNGLVSGPDEVIDTHSPWIYYNTRLNDCSPSAQKTVHNVMVESSNIGMAKIIVKGWGEHPEEFYNAIKRTGFFEPFSTGIAGQHPVVIDSLRNVTYAAPLKLSRMAFGYSTMIPPINTLALYNAIANNGRFVSPRLVRGLHSAEHDTIYDVQVINEHICTERTLRLLQDMMRDVVEQPKGTAYRALRNGRVRVSGKTGTCNVMDSSFHYVSGKSRLAFCGYFPTEQPRYSCIAVVSPPRQNAFGAAYTSGVVVQAVADALFARGMFGEESDYRADSREEERSDKTTPVYYASADADKAGRMHSVLKVQNGGVKRVKSPAAPSGGVPDVSGYNIREAIRTMERAGYNVTFSGNGCVVAQTPAPGSGAKRGTTVQLTLRR